MFKVGDKIRLKEGLKDGKYYGETLFVDDMKYFFDKNGYCTIKEIIEGDIYLKEYEYKFIYSSEMLEPYNVGYEFGDGIKESREMEEKILKVWELEEDTLYACAGIIYKVLNGTLYFETNYKQLVESTNNLRQLKEMELTEIKEKPVTFKKYEKVQVRDWDNEEWKNRYYLETIKDTLGSVYKTCTMYDEFTGDSLCSSCFNQIRKLGDE